MTGWQKFQIISTAIGAILIPFVLALVGYLISSAIKEREVQGKFVELAVNILTKPPQKEYRELRKWSVDVINLYSGIPFSETAKKELIDNIPLIGDMIHIKIKVVDELGKDIKDASLKLYGIKNNIKTAFFSGYTNQYGENGGRTNLWSAYDAIEIEVSKPGYETYLHEVFLIAPVTIVGVVLKKVK
jgi:hypothetical protein